jgi:hypothetical protein
VLKQLSSFIAGPAGLVVILFFFLPWVTISCSGGAYEIEATGLDLATGDVIDQIEQDTQSTASMMDAGLETEGTTEADISFSGGDLEADEVFTEALDTDNRLWLILVAGFIAAGLAIGRAALAMTNPNSPDLRPIAALVYIFVAVIGLGVQLIKYLALEDLRNEFKNAPEAMASMSYEIGFWITLIALFGILVGGLVALIIEGPATDQAPRSSPEPSLDEILKEDPFG